APGLPLAQSGRLHLPLPTAELEAAAARERADGRGLMSSQGSGTSPAELRWSRVVEWAQRGNPEPPRRVEKPDSDWRAELTEEQYHVTRRKGTERPFSSALCALFEPGRYHCL